MKDLSLGIDTLSEFKEFVLSSEEYLLHRFKNLSEVMHSAREEESRDWRFALTTLASDTFNYAIVLGNVPRNILFLNQRELLSQTCALLSSLSFFQETLSYQKIIPFAERAIQSYLSLADALRSS